MPVVNRSPCVPTNATQSDWMVRGLTCLVGVLGGSSATLMASHEGVNKGEVMEIVTRNSPYIEDRRALQGSIDTMTKAIEDNGETLKVLTVAINERERRLTQLEVKVDMLIKRLGLDQPQP